MNTKNLRYYILIILINFYCVQSYAESIFNLALVGQCEASFENYLIKIFGEDFRQDENIKVENIKYKSTLESQYFLAWDNTPSANPMRYLFKVGETQSCMILFMPFSDSYQLKLDKKGNLPSIVSSQDRSPPGFYSIKIKYKLNKDGIYYPIQCLQYLESGKYQPVDCKKIYSDIAG